MKYFVILLLAIILFSCNENNKAEEVIDLKSDTSLSLVKKNNEVDRKSKTDYSEENFRSPVDPKKLEKVFPEEFRNFKLSKPSSGMLSDGNKSHSTSERYFKSGNSIIIMRITDYVFKENIPELKYLSTVPEKMDMRGELLNTEDYYGNMSWNDNKDSGEISVLMYNRFLIKLEVRNTPGFSLEVINFINKFDKKSLNKLKNS